MRIIIFEGTFKTTTFINRLVFGLSEKHDVYILGFNESLKNPIKRVNYVKLGSNTSKIRFIKTSFALAFSQLSVKLLFSTLIHILRFNRTQLRNQNFKIAVDTIKPDIIHAQWVSNIPILEPILSQNTYPVILSQRGYHINVRPFIDSKNFEYLKKWFPKITGFHSVSEAISYKGDLIYNSPSKINHVVYSGLNLLKMEFKNHYKKGIKLQLVSVGRTHWVKGYEYALAACSILKEQGVDFLYTIVGAGQNEELIYLRQFYKFEDEVVFLNSMPQQDVFETIRKADVMLLPSVEEGIANVAIEAMALGTLVISTNCGGMTELIEHEKEGWIVPTRSPDSIADAVIGFNKKTDVELNEIRNKARKKIEKIFTETNMVKGMECLYMACLNEKN